MISNVIIGGLTTIAFVLVLSMLLDRCDKDAWITRQ